MKDQVIANRTPRTSRGAAAQPRGFVQRPARRHGGPTDRSWSFSPRTLFGYVPLALKFVLVILGLVTVFVGYRVAASASLFQVRGIDVTGTSRTSAEEIQGLTRRAVAKTGVWRADLSAISSELERLPGVRRAVVSRVLPDRLRVRITERMPVAVVHAASGNFFWVDDEGVALGEMKLTENVQSFFICGWNEEGTEEARKDNAERVQKYLELSREWTAMGLADRVSEVNLIDLRDVRTQLAGKDSQIEVRLGGQDLGKRLKRALDTLDEYRDTPQGAAITYVDLQTDRVVLGHSSGSKAATVSDTPAVDSNASGPNSITPAIPKPAGAANANRKAPTNDQKQKPAPTRAGREPASAPRIRMR
jgi:cell division protein FtsQ